MEHEMNFLDLCVAFGRAIGKACRHICHWLAELVRLTYRLWWVVIPIMILALAAGMYYTRNDNLNYKIQAIALLNGASIEQFDQRYGILASGLQLSKQDPLKKVVTGRIATRFESFYVVDVFNDSIADYVDYNGKSSPADTIDVQMKDRIALQFCMKKRNLDQLPQIEKQLLDFFNADESMQKSYALYRENMLRAQQFNHDQLEKLDSLTSEYYFKSNPGANPLADVREGLVFMGDWKVHLFLDEIYSHQRRTEHMDRRASFMTAPVVLENHFVVNPNPINAPKRMLPLFLIAGWLCGCCLAVCVEQRKRIISWLRK